MSTLADYQKSLRDLIKGRAAPPPHDQHLAEVAQSPGLKAIREIAVWWRTLAVEEYCPWTSRVLKKLGVFRECVEDFYCGQNVSSYVEKAGEQFLVKLNGHPHPLVATVSAFELAVLKVKQGDTREFAVEWDRNPDAVFACLADGSPLPPEETDRYQTFVSSAIPGMVRCDRMIAAGP